MKKLYYLFALLAAVNCTSLFATTHTVQVRDFEFIPANVNAQVGDTVRWVWVNGSHTSTSAVIPTGALPWNSPINQTIQSFSYKVTRPGEYNYFCTPHAPSMAGTITVTSTGIGENYNFSDWVAYPQPFTDELTLSTGKFTGFVQAQLFDLTGRQVAETEKTVTAASKNMTFQTSSLPSGIYFCTVMADGRKRTFRLVRE